MPWQSSAGWHWLGMTQSGGSAMLMSRPMRLLRNLRITLEMIKFEHSVFALPFALTGAMLAARGLPSARQLFWIVVAMVGARSAAMSFNRIADLRLDAANPRTATRALPAGLLSVRFAVLFTVASAGLLVLAAYQLNPLCFRLSPLALALLFLYSYTKRFTWLTHLVLGLCLGLAPAAAWIAVRGSLDWPILLLSAAVALWVSGFDIIYACQDLEFDRQGRFVLLAAATGHSARSSGCRPPAPPYAGATGGAGGCAESGLGSACLAWRWWELYWFMNTISSSPTTCLALMLHSSP